MANCFPSVSQQTTCSPIPGYEDGNATSSVVNNRWDEILWPDSLLLHIFSFLAPRDVVQAGAVSKRWHRIALDELLWKNIVTNCFGVDRRSSLPPLSTSWASEYQRLECQTPVIQTQILTEHNDEVLHVAFAHNGQYFVSSSKDCSAILWEDKDGKVERKATYCCHHLGWEYVQFSEFSPDDTLLLISGVNKMRQFSFRGEIAIYTLGESKERKAFIINEPYDVFGTWLNNRYFVSGNFLFAEPLDYISTVSELWANCVDDPELPANIESESSSERVNLCRIINKNSSSVRSVAVARPQGCNKVNDTSEAVLIFTHGSVTYTPHQVLFKRVSFLKESQLLKKGFSNVLSKNQTVCYTSTDHVIETNAHIIGLALSPDHKFLYVNCRPWVTDGKSVCPGEPPEISDLIHLRVYDLSSYQLIKEHIGHKAFTPNEGCFFIFLNVSGQLVASGAEDKGAHVWDRHYGVKLATLEGHKNVVNAVAFNPADPEMLVSASDDHTLGIWRSRRKTREFQMQL